MTKRHPPPSPLAGEGRGEGVSGMTNRQSRPSVMPPVVNPPSVMPHAFNSPSVIPDIFNRESMAFPMQAHTNKGTTKQDTGFPLTTGGNDRESPAGMTEGTRRA